MRQQTLRPCRACGERKKKARYKGRPDLPRGLCTDCYRARMKNPTYGQRLPSPTATGHMRRYNPEHPLSDPQGLILVHREVWYDAHGPIPDGHDIHHLNGDRTDNRLENLELMEHAKHWRHHLEERGTVTNQHGTWPLRKT